MDVVSLQGPLTVIGIGDGVSGTCTSSTACQLADMEAYAALSRPPSHRAHPRQCQDHGEGLEHE